MSFNPDAPHTDGLSPESALKVTSGNVVTTMVEQPKPKFTLLDLESALDTAHAAISRAIKADSDSMRMNEMVVARSEIHELIATISRIKNDLDVIEELPSDNNAAITSVINTEKPEFSVCGVQLKENGKLVGVSLYSTIVKARKIRDILNSKFAELRVNHEATIINYPVY